MDKSNTKGSRSLKNDRNNKDLLRTEINNATDPTVRLELTKMLLEVEKEEKIKRTKRWVIAVIIITLLLCFLLYLGNKSKKISQKSEITETTFSSSPQVTGTKTTETSIIETSLSEEQLEEWVMAILSLTPPPPTKYIFTIRVDDTDNLAYIHVGVDQLDGVGIYRVNAKGQLEFHPRNPTSNWVVISEKFMDTSLAEEYYREQKKEQSDAQNQLDLVRDELVDRTFIIKPLLYDGVDVEQAMKEHNAPQNLIHDGVQRVTFTDDVSVTIELAGTYRPDYSESYTLSTNTINLKDYYIPYSLNNGTFSFDTWTTNVDEHVVTWAMIPQN